MNQNPSLKHLVGKSLKTYRIEEQIEQWETDGVYLGRSSVSQRPYRLHVLFLPPRLSPEERMVALGQFQHQAHALMMALTRDEALPRHPHLLPLLDVDHDGDFLYLVAPAMPATTLTALLAVQGPLDVLVASRYLDQVASALEYAHERALFHGNLTTDAVLVLQDRNCVVADLGVARLSELSRPGQLPASFYAAHPSAVPAPEQLLGQAPRTATDVYALAALLYRMLTGRAVFTAASYEQMREQHLHAPVPSVATWRRILVGQADVTMALDRLLLAAMAKDPHQRIQHPAELANAYYQIIAPNDGQRQPVRSPLMETLAAPLPATQLDAEETRGEQYAREGGQRMLKARRRTLLFVGGGVVTVGMLACVISQVLGARTGISFVPTSSPTPGVTPTPTPAGQGTVTPGETTPTPTPTVSGNVIAQAAALPPNSSKTFQNPNSNSPQPGVLIHLPDGRFVAYDSTCTHESSCSVGYVSQDKLLECPCHGAQFDPANRANVLQGPAPTPLAPIAITVHPDGSITTN